MEYRSLGYSGLRVSPLCLGTMNFGGPTPESEAEQIILAALEGGINFIDTADAYHDGESERVVGRALKENSRRDEVVLATKVYNPTGPGPNERDLSRFHIIRACEESLRRLQTDRIDLYQLHRISAYGIDQEESLRALEDLSRSGKVLCVGTSTFPAWVVMEGLSISQRHGWVRYTSEQPPYNLLDRRIENELIPLAQKYDLAILPWSPIAKGILAGRYLPGDKGPAREAVKERLNPKAREVGAKMVELAGERSLSAAQLALLWCKDQPGITAPIIGPRTLDQLHELLPVLEMHLDDEDRRIFDELVHPGNAVADFHNTSRWMKAQI
jgi:aryl-alcohol dehydrogenase-like predicted oxidoreductase